MQEETVLRTRSEKIVVGFIAVAIICLDIVKFIVVFGTDWLIVAMWGVIWIVVAILAIDLFIVAPCLLCMYIIYRLESR